MKYSACHIPRSAVEVSMRSLRSRFVLSHILPVLVAVPLAGVILIYLLETQVVLTQMADDISEKANLDCPGR